MVINDALPDYYAILQVHPDADQEVIEAAYRQLMKKHHPDLAGGAADKHRRATEINGAYAVLRNPAERRRYDLMRQMVGTRRPAPTQQPPRPAPPRPGPPPSSPPPPPPPAPTVIEVPGEASPLPPPLSWLAAAYYLLPGKYEWEGGQGGELLTILLVPLVGSLAFALVTGRLGPLIGRSPGATLGASLLIALLALPLIPALPRVFIACAPGAVLLTGTLNRPLTDAHIPLWLAWTFTGLVALLMSARLYIFGFLPMLLICALLARF